MWAWYGACWRCFLVLAALSAIFEPLKYSLPPIISDQQRLCVQLSTRDSRGVRSIQLQPSEPLRPSRDGSKTVLSKCLDGMITRGNHEEVEITQRLLRADGSTFRLPIGWMSNAESLNLTASLHLFENGLRQRSLCEVAWITASQIRAAFPRRRLVDQRQAGSDVLCSGQRYLEQLSTPDWGGTRLK